ncbi:MAG: hypothetical protein HYV09_29325 [Deltaproteobacteria bacterium]|nr:hypothetical protein [Deltaproteobacteria bacterium]
MTRRRSEPPAVAVGVDGRVYLSVFELDGVETLENATLAVGSRGTFFIGVAITAAERRRLLRSIRSASREAAAFIAGGRRWR